MEELHAALAAHLRAQRRQLAETGERESAILNIWQDRCAVPSGTIGAAAIDNTEAGRSTLADIRRVRECHDPYIPS